MQTFEKYKLEFAYFPLFLLQALRLGVRSRIKMMRFERSIVGRVLLMKHKFTGEQYALKELNAVADQQARRTAGNELRIAQRHASGTQHLVGLLNAFFIDGKICGFQCMTSTKSL